MSPYVVLTEDGPMFEQSVEPILVESPEDAAVILFARDFKNPGWAITGRLYEIEPSTGFIADIPMPGLKFTGPVIDVDEVMEVTGLGWTE